MDEVKGLIVGVDNPENITSVKVLSGEVLSLAMVKEKLKEGQIFSVVDPESGQVAYVIELPDGTLKMKLPNGDEKDLHKVPTFT